MRIGIDCRALANYTDGIGKYTLRLLEELSKIDNTNEYVLFFCKNYKGSRDFGRNYIAVDVPYRHLTLSSIYRFGDVVNEYNLDVFHSTFFIMPHGVKCKKVMTVPDLMCLRVKNFFSGRLWPIELYAKSYHKIFVPDSIKRADKLIAISRTTAVDILNLIGIAQEKIDTIYLGVDSIFKKHTKQEMENVGNKYKLPENYILYTGNTKPYKNIPYLIRSYAAYKKSGGTYKLIMISYRDRFRNVVENLVGELNIGSDVMFLDEVIDGDIPKIMSKAKIFTFVSLSEGFGLPVVEAMACGCPTVISDIPALKEISGDAGICVSLNDHQAMAETLLLLEKDSKLRELHSLKGMERAKIYSWAKYALETNKVYINTYQGN